MWAFLDRALPLNMRYCAEQYNLFRQCAHGKDGYAENVRASAAATSCKLTMIANVCPMQSRDPGSESAKEDVPTLKSM